MAVGEAVWPVMHPVAGVAFGTASAGIKKVGRTDILVMALSARSRVAGVFTRNAFCAAPVILGREHLASTAGAIRYLVINSGNANACTGDRGLADAKTTCDWVAKATGVSANQVLPFSTGVIGEYLPLAKIEKALPDALALLDDTAWDKAAGAIMTTDTRPKGASVQFDWAGHRITVTGIAKGAGMIRPNMATMLAYIATDAAVPTELLQTLVTDTANQSFNRISIDGDTSTNDSCILIATGESGAPAVSSHQDPLYAALQQALLSVFQSLAIAVVRDGEGATKCVTVDVSEGASRDECLAVAYAIAHSPLIKTALFASDPNWGRIICAIGYAGLEKLDPSRVQVFLDDVCIVKNGQRASTYTEEQGKAVVSRAEFCIRVQLGRGSFTDQVWTTDLSHDYVTINAEYRS
jgi:glutamate N-acetyltransferase / amino-acid N-acetyltransferase